MAGNTIEMIYKIDTIEDFVKWKKNQSVYEEKGIKFPALNAVLVSQKLIQPNDYNPNHVAKDKMKLLEISIKQNGFCFGVVSIFDNELEKFVIIDGFHRFLIASEEYLKLDYIPLVILNHDLSKRLSATVQFNKARGVHRIDGNAELVRRMVEIGMEDIDICKALGMEADEVLRLKRNIKIADVFKDINYSNSWGVV